MQNGFEQKGLFAVSFAGMAQDKSTMKQNSYR
jgi:hypothetical protein